MKNIFKNILKLSLAVGLVYYLLASGKLDFKILFTSLKENTSTWIFAIVFTLVNYVLMSYRWKKLVEIKTKKKYSLLTVTKLTWIGALFNTVLPGAVSGDLVKLLYAKDMDKNISKTYLLTTILMDRILGLMSLLFILGFSSIIYYNELIQTSKQIAYMIHINFILFGGSLLFLLTLFLPSKIQNFFLGMSKKIPILGKQVANTLEQVWTIGRSKKTIFFTIGISILIQSITIFIFWELVSPYFGKDVSIKYAFSFVPIGMISTSIPISPAGLGVGHAVFDTLFSYFGVQKGASLFNLQFILIVFINLLGIVPYLMSGKKHNLQETKELES
ncbi:MAG: lysylphosphatidylglycerol synthase transmembrane domain-containing protein [Bacteriovoracaceae bacterium]